MARQAATGSTDRGSPARARAWAELGIVAGVVLALMVLNGLLGLSDNVVLRRLSGIVGVAFIVALALLFSDNRRGINRKTVCVGLAIQFVLAVLLLYTPLKTPLFRAMDHAFTRLTDFGMDGTHFLFGWLVPLHPGLKAGMTIASVIIFLGAVMRMLYYLGVMQVVVRGMAYVMRRLMGVSGAESLGTAANVFVGMVESALTVRPYVAGMTRSELFTLMTAGMATVAGSVMAAYTGFVKPFLGENAGGHLVTASLISAPAAIMIAGIGGIAPNQRPNLARLGLLSIVGGSLAAFTTGCLAGLLG